MAKPPPLGVAFSGGGMRAYSAFIGYVRGLGADRFERRCGMVSTVSGGSWFYGTYAYARSAGFSHQSLLAPVVAPHSTAAAAMAARASDARFLERALQVLSHRNSASKLSLVWNAIIGAIFLEPYGIDARARMPPFTVPLPMWVCNASIIHLPLLRAGIVPSLQISPGAVSAPGLLLGSIPSAEVRACSSVPGVSIRDAMGLSSLAGGGKLVQGVSFVFSRGLPEEAPEQHDHYVRELTDSLLPVLALPALPTMILCDGAITDNTGIVTLLSRGARKVLAFVATRARFRGAARTAARNMQEVHALFGARPPLPASLDVIAASGNTVQVFASADLGRVQAQLQLRAAQGGPVWFSGKLRVVPNPAYGVEGNYDVELCLIVLASSRAYAAERLVRGLGPLPPGFPYYSTVFHNSDDMIGLTPEQVEHMHMYTEWCMRWPALQPALNALLK
jgi:hypothetical protein